MPGKAAILEYPFGTNSEKKGGPSGHRHSHQGPHIHSDHYQAIGPRYAFRAFPEILLHLSSANTRVLLLDLDGTLVGLRRKPENVRVSARTKKVLAKLTAVPKLNVAILSGRNVRSLRKLVDVKQLRYFGLHGSESDDREAHISAEARRALTRARRSVLKELASFPGVEIEDKGCAFTVHYRGAGEAAVREANQALLTIVAPLRHALHVLNGKKVWEVLPHTIPGKGGAMQRVMQSSPDAALAYIGDDEPDEPAFAVLRRHVTIHVGSRTDTHARFYLRNPGEVLRFLSQLEKELRKIR